MHRHACPQPALAPEKVMSGTQEYRLQTAFDLAESELGACPDHTHTHTHTHTPIRISVHAVNVFFACLRDGEGHLFDLEHNCLAQMPLTNTLRDCLPPTVNCSTHGSHCMNKHMPTMPRHWAGVDQLLDVEDLVEFSRPDDRSIILYLSCVCKALVSL